MKTWSDCAVPCKLGMPGYRGSAAGSSEPASRAKAARTRTTYGLKIPGTRPDSGVKSGKAREKEERYRELFLASSAVDVHLAHNLVRFANTMNPFSKEQQVSALLGNIPMEQFLKELNLFTGLSSACAGSKRYQSLLLKLLNNGWRRSKTESRRYGSNPGFAEEAAPGRLLPR